MNAFDRLQARGFALLVAKTDGPTLSRLGKTCTCVSTAINETKEQRDAGYWPHFSGIVEILRTDCLRLGLDDRSIVGYTPAGGTKLFLKVLGFDGRANDGDPCVRVTLKEEPGVTAER